MNRELTERQDIDGSIWIPSTPLPHMRQLDALRAIAVLAVLVYHLIPLTSPRLFFASKLIDLGGLGVRLFFVLSGFLITGIILKLKTYREKCGLSLFLALRQFYARRFLRILPLSYLALAIAVILNLPPVRKTLLWHAGYLTNLYLFRHGWTKGVINHYWSLAVEEQFYLAWPWLILLVSRRRLPLAILVTIAVGPVFRLVCGLYTHNNLVPILPLSCLDTLGIGALLALHRDRMPHQQPWHDVFATAVFLLGIVVLASFALLGVMQRDVIIRPVIFDVGAGLLAASLVSKASIGFKGAVGKLLDLKVLAYLGTISYGIYVYHFGMDHVLHKTLGIPHIAELLSVPRAWPLDSLLIAGCTIAVAALSWHFFERPINNLKRHFEYDANITTKRCLSECC